MNPVAAGLAAVWLLGLTLVAQTPGPQVAPRPNDPFFNADLAPKPHVRALSPAEELKTFLLPPGYRLEPVLTEPDVQEPMQIAFDGNGRMFVLENRGYMQDADATGELDPVGRISVHEDADNDGVYEKHTVFLDKLVFPRFVLPFGPNSILTMESNTDDVFRFTDTNGDGVADKKELFTTNFGRSGNVEHQQSSLFLSMDNWMYTTYNTFRVRWTPKGVLREPTGTNNGQWGITQDNDGKVYFQTGEGGVPTYFQFPIHYGTFNMPGQLEPGLTTPWGVTGLGDYQPGTNAIRQGELTLGRVTGGAGNDVYRGDRLPADLVGDYLYGEPVARIVRRLTPVVTEGITQLRQVYQWQHAEFIRSADPLFRPVDMATAPDGTLYIVDTYRGIIQEGNWTRPGSYLRAKIDQYGLDKIVRHGRIWRLTYDGIARDRTPPRMNGEPPAQLVGRLSHPNGWWRDTAQQLLILKQDRSVVPALRQLARSGSSVHERIHALWTLEGLGALDAALARELIKDPNPKIRIHAVRTSETLYKDGDKSLGNEYRALLGDSDVDVVIQAMLTLNLFKVPDLAALVKAAQERTPARGVREVGNRILMPPAVGRGGRGRTPEETALLERGETIYKELCTTCHGTDGLGTPKEGAPAGTTMAPALSGSRRVQDHRDYVIKSLLHGLTGPVDGDTYTEVMVPMGTNKDDWIAAVASYVRTGFGNTGSIVTTADVARVRQATAARKAPWTVEELTKLLPTLVAVQPTWKVSASHNPATAGYGLNYIAWSTGEPQKPGMWFQIELPEPLMLTELVFDTTSGGRGGVPTGAFAIAGPVPGGTPLPSATPTTPAPDPAAARAGGPPAPPVQGYPREYKIEVSLDGTKWTAAAIGMGEPGTITVAFAPVRARFVRITQTGDVPGAPPWSIQRLRVYQAPSAR
jgi:glucose/arabinose dehydrogenase/mono/diheme cytochrome c family protein